MKSQINLLSDEFKPHFELICASHLSGFVFFVIVLCGLAYSGLAYQHMNMKDQVDQSKSDIAAERKTVESLTNEIMTRTTDPLLESKLADLSLRTQDRTELLRNIKSLSALKQRSFSTLFSALSQSHTTSLWLTSFSVKPDELSLQGKLNSPSALPIWIRHLSDTEFFKGQHFNIANLIREDDSLRFELKSEPRVKDDNSAAKVTGGNSE